MEVNRVKRLKKWWTLQKTGGLTYHYLALRYGRSLWRPFKQSLAEALHTWKPRESKLLLIGPSAGYCLPSAFLNQFSQISALEQDPLAPPRFRRQHPQVSVLWRTPDYFFNPDGSWQSEGPTKLVRDYPDYSLLFCNLLGQLTPRCQLANFTTWKANFTRTMEGASFFSFHDLYSSPVSPIWPSDLRFPSANHSSAHCELLRRYTQTLEQSTKPSKLILRDHLTHDLFDSRPRVWALWSLTPQAHHIIEMVHNP